MKKKLLILLSVLTLVCCALFGVSVVGSAQTQTIVKTSGSLEIKSSYTAAQQLMYYKTPVKGAVTLEFDYKPNAWNAKWGFGLTTDNKNSNPYSSRMIYCENDIGKGGSYWTPWASSFVGSQKPWQNYNENYAGEYKIFQKVRIKMEVNANGDTTLFAKSLESAGTYAGNNPQQTEYVQVSDTIEGLYSKEVKADNCYIAFFFVAGASSSYYYGFTATDTVGTYTDDQAAANLTDNYILSDGVLADLNAGNLVYTPAVTEDIEVIPEDVEGALVFSPEYAWDGMINNKVKLVGAMDIEIDLDYSGFNNFGFGLMSTYGDSSPYNSNLLFTGKAGAFTPWGDALLSEANGGYLNGYTMSGRVTLTLSINANGDATFYANGAKILDTIEGLYADEVNGGYFCMFARIGSEKAYLYSVVIKDGNGNKLHKLDFSYDILNTANFHFTSAVQAGLGSMLYWQQPSGKYVPAPTAEISVSSIVKSINQNGKINLTPIITNRAETDVLTVTVDGNAIEDLEYTFTETGYHTVEYVVVNAEGEELDKATVNIFVKANSTQNNAETNFNQGYFDGREFEATNGVAVKDNALYFKSEGTALFTTAGYSENFIITFDITSYVAGGVKAVFGCIDGNEYAFTFLANGNVEFGGVEYEVGKNIYEALAGGSKVTVRVKVFGGNASLFVRFSNESVENIEIALVTVKEINVVGKVGFGGENAEFTADNVKFVSLTSVDEDNTYYPSDEELNPDTGDDEPEDTSSTQSSASEGKKGCKSSMSMGSLLSVAALLGAVILKKKEN